jgi:predicted choloylglycine hydrolase
MLKGMVQRVVSDRSKFAHIDDNELEARKAFVQSSEASLSAIRGELFSASAKGKQEADERQSLASASASARDATPASKYDTAHANVFQSQQQVRRQQEENQDQHLSAIDDSLTRLGDMAKNIDDELTEQQTMLGDVEEDMDDTHNKMNANLAVIGKMLKTKDRCQIITIVLLLLMLVGLFIAVLSGM